MAKIIQGERVGRQGRLSVGTAAVIRDAAGRVLLTRRADNGRWCLPGGRMEPGESAAECCAREVLEETGLRVRFLRLVGVYTSPDRLVTYPDGNRWQVVAVCFAAEVVDGTLGLSDETTEYGYFSPAQLADLDIMENHRERILDTLADQPAAFIK